MASSQIPVVGVYTDGTFTQIFPNAQMMKLNIRERAQVMEHPLETGTVITDHRIILPNELELSVILDALHYKSTYQQIKTFFLNSSLLAVQTKTAVYGSLLISEIPHEESPELFDVIAMGIKLKQALFVAAQTGVFVQDPNNNDTVNRGVQQGMSILPNSMTTAGFS